MLTFSRGFAVIALALTVAAGCASGGGGRAAVRVQAAPAENMSGASNDPSPLTSLAHEVLIPLDHDGDYVWESQPVALPDSVKAAGSNGPDAFSVAYRVTDGTAQVSGMHAIPVVSDSGETTIRVSFSASGASDGAKLEIVDISASKSDTSSSAS